MPKPCKERPITYFPDRRRLRNIVTIVEVTITVGLCAILGTSTLGGRAWPWIMISLGLIALFVAMEGVIGRHVQAMPAEQRRAVRGDDVEVATRTQITAKQQILGLLLLIAVALLLGYHRLNQSATSEITLARMLEACPVARPMIRETSESGVLTLVQREKLQDWIDRRAEHEAKLFLATGAEIGCRRPRF